MIDTSVWVDHFKRGNAELAELLLRDDALVHPMVIGELACGTPPSPRTRTLSNIALLRTASHATSEEVMSFIESEELYGLGCGWIDMTLLASTLITPGATLWTLDQQLGQLAKRFDIEFRI